MKDEVAFAVYKAETSVKKQTTSPDNLEFEQAIALVDKIRNFPTTIKKASFAQKNERTTPFDSPGLFQ